MAEWCKAKKDPPSFVKHHIDDKIGYGVFATNLIKKHAFVLEYEGQLLSETEGEEVETVYEKAGKGCFIYFFQHEKKTLCVDATNSGQLGKFVNDSPKGNCIMRKDIVDGKPHLCLYATKDIPAGEELRYNYGYRGLWWRKEKDCQKPRRLSSSTLKQVVERAP